MNANQRRFLAYPVAAAVAGTLLWTGVLREVDADFGTLVGSAQIHAELAAGLPADSDKPDARELRAKLLADAESWIERAERSRAGSIEVDQLRAYIAVLRGEYDAAASGYRALRTREDCPADVRELSFEHEAKVWSIAGDHERALRVLEAGPIAESADTGHRALHTRLLWRAGEQERAKAEAAALGKSEDHDARLVGAELLQDMGAWEAAEAAFESTDPELRDYRLARLKLLAGQTDTAVELLERAIAEGGPEVLSAYQADRHTWVEHAGERFVEPTPTSAPAAPAAER